MKTASAKAKGRNLQKYVRDAILNVFKHLHVDDVQSRSMGAQGEDIMLSPTARKVLPVSIECKNRAAIAIYKDYEQACYNAGLYEPVLIVKQNRDKPLVVVDLHYFLRLHEFRQED